MEHLQYNSDSTAFVNNFWGCGFAGKQVIDKRIQNGIRTLEELISFFEAKVRLEKEYNKKLENLNAKSFLGNYELGSLKRALDRVNIENRQMQKDNLKFIKSVSEINLFRMKSFYNSYRKKVDRIVSHMSKLESKYLESRKCHESAKEKYHTQSSNIKSTKLSVQTTWGKEAAKNEQKLRKLTAELVDTRNSYKESIANMQATSQAFERDWSLAIQEIFELEIERIQVCKINCFNYCNNIATLCVDNDHSADMARTEIAQVSPSEDIKLFSDKYGTGNKIYSAPEFVDFMEGHNEEDFPPTFKISKLTPPDHSSLIAKSYSIHSVVTNRTSNSSASEQKKQNAHASPVVTNVNVMKDIPEIPPQTPSKNHLQVNGATQKGARSDSVGSISPDENGNDVFSVNEKYTMKKLNSSNGSSNYSQPTNYSTNSSANERNWSSPRRKEKQLMEFQEGIDSKYKKSFKSPHIETPKQKQKQVPIIKDFSIDFISKALENLNSGGDGDVNQFRKSVRANELANKPKSAPTTPQVRKMLVTRSDLIDDHEDIAVRYDSLNQLPRNDERLSRADVNGSPRKANVRQRPKSMLLDDMSFQQEKYNTNVNRSLSKSPTKSYQNLHSLLSEKQIKQVTPHHNCKYESTAIAMYNYVPQHHGELSFKKGWTMYIIHKQEDNWYVAELGNNGAEEDGNLGLIPGNYVKENCS